MKWLSIWWYKYLFEKPSPYFDVSLFTSIWCRLRNHPKGMIWFSCGHEPNYHCKNCGDELS